MPAGRTVAWNPKSGGVGFILVSGVSVNLTKWEPKIKGDPIDGTNFNSARDPLNNRVHREWLIGAVDGEFTITGLRDGGAIGWNPMPGDNGAGYFAYDTDFGFDIEYLVVDVGGGQDATKAGEFTCTVKANGLISFDGRYNFGVQSDFDQ